MKATATEQAAKLCDKGSRLRIITDEKFNILWNNKDFEPGEIAFSDIKGKAPKDGAVFSVYVNGSCHSAECVAVNTDGQKLFIWILCTASENIFRLGYTNTYKEVSYIFDTLKNNIDILAHLAEVIARESPEVKTTANEQTRICRDLTRYVDTLSEISSIIYGHADKEKTVLIFREADDVIQACNRFLNTRGHTIKLLTTQAGKLKDVSILGDRQIIDSILFGLIRHVIISSNEKNHVIDVYTGNKSVYIQLKYHISDQTKENLEKIRANDFNNFAAKLYIEYIGGSISISESSKSEEIIIEFPIHKSRSILKSNYAAISMKELDRLAEMYLSDLL